MGSDLPFLRLLSTLVARARLSAAGGTFGGLRDLYTALGYKRDLSISDFRDRYERGDIAARIVEAMPWATWRAGGEVIETPDPNKVTEFERIWLELSVRLQMWPTFLRADVLAGLGRYSIVLIGAPGAPDTPLRQGLRAEEIAYLQPYAEDDAKILKFDTAMTSSRFGRPEFYQISFSRMVSEHAPKEAATPAKVHWTRIIHFADTLLDDNVFGQPRLKRVWNRLDDLEKVAGGGSEAFWLRVHQGMHLNVDKDVDVSTEELDRLKEQAKEYEHGLRRMFTTRGTEVNMLGSDVAPIDKHIDALLTLIAGAVGIPKRILIGSERGQLASNQDKDNWDERVMDRRNNMAGPQIVRQLVDRFVDFGVLPKPEKYEVTWPEIQRLSALDRADMAVKWGNINHRMGVVVVRPSEIRETVLGLHPDPALDKALEDLMKAKADAAKRAEDAAAAGDPDALPGEPPDDRPSRSQRIGMGEPDIPLS